MTVTSPEERTKCTPISIAALFTITRIWKQPKRPSLEKSIKKIWKKKKKEDLVHIYTRILLSHKKEQNCDVCRGMAEPGDYYTE